MINFSISPSWAPEEEMVVQWDEGQLTGDKMAVAWVNYRARQGHEVNVTPTGPAVVVDPADVRTVNGALKELGDLAVDGDDFPPWPYEVPTVHPGDSPVIY